MRVFFYLKYLLLLSTFLSFCPVFSQLIEVDFPFQDLGTVSEASSVKVDFILKNKSSSKIYLMRADTEKDVKVKAAKKTLLPNDTTLITTFLELNVPGNYEKQLSLVISALEKPLVLKFKVKVLSVKNDGTLACYTFHKSTGKAGLIEIPINEAHLPKPDISVKMIKPVAVPVPKDTLQIIPEKNSVVLNPLLYKPNNLVFLIDNSGSMLKEKKFEYLKLALDSIVKIIRPQDKISLITFADSVILQINGANSDKRNDILKIVSGLKVKGTTRGAKAVLFAQDIAIQNYIPEGNNQVFLVTDGKFPFYKGHYEQWESRLCNKNIFLSSIAVGNDKEGIENLRNISSMGKGAFVRIKNEKSVADLIEKIKETSKR